MKLSGNTILITGGASGIGLALAERFAARGNHLILCGRREDMLRDAAARLEQAAWRVCDVADPRQRDDLARWAAEKYPELNVLVNNAGIQRRTDLTRGEEWEETRSEIAINLDAPIHLARLFYPQLAKQRSAAIINVTSGLSFVPLANVPVYCATKAALHSFTLSLRHQLAGSTVEVIEVIPPAVDTDLGGPGLHTFGVNVNEFADHVLARLEEGNNEIAYGTALKASEASAEERRGIFDVLNARTAN